MGSNKIQLKKLLSICITTSFLGLTVVFVGHGCSKVGESKRSGSGLASSGLLGNDVTDSITIYANTKTVSTVYAKQFLDNMVSCTGLKIESARTRGEWESRKGSLSEFGYATDITPPMLMAIAATAGEICSDIIDKEKVSESPVLFADFNLEGSTNSTEVRNAIQRVALSCWQRRASENEVGIISDMVNQTAENMNGEQAALLICASMLSSYKSIEM